MGYQDSLFEVFKYSIPCSQLNEPIYLIPFGDVHRYAPLCDENHWLEFIDWAKNKKRCYFLGMGDYDDLASYSERRVLNAEELHESTQESLDEVYYKRVKDFYKEIAFMKGKLIGLIEGNHYAKFSSGDTSTQRLCQYLGCKYLGKTCAVRLIFKYGTKSASIDLYAHHGAGASRLVGGSLNKVQQMDSNIWADIYLQGHDHKKSIAFQSVLYLSHSKTDVYLKKKKIMYARTGSFLKGYVPGKPSYVAERMLTPCDLGVIKIELTPRRSCRENTDLMYIDIHGSI